MNIFITTKLEKQLKKYQDTDRFNNLVSRLKLAEKENECIKWNTEIQSRFKKEDVKIEYKPNKKIKALIGDYSTTTAPMTNFVLKSLGIQTEFVPNAYNVIDKIESGSKYDVIITNNVYPKGGSGQQVLSYIRKNNIDIPIVILTVDQDSHDKYVNNIGFDEYMAKPLDIEKATSTLPKVIKGLKFNKEENNKSK